MDINDIQSIEGPFYALRIREPKNRPLLVSFGAMAQKPLFSFFGVTFNVTDIQKIFVRDSALMYYQYGLPPVANNILESVEYLRKLIQEMNPSRTVFVGSSTGGYAAILYGSYLNVDTVHAFSPLTDISKKEYIFSKDKHEKMIQTCPDQHFSLSRVLNQLEYETTINLHFDKTYDFDKMHADFLVNNRGVVHHKYTFGKHDLAMELRSKGKLLDILIADLD